MREILYRMNDAPSETRPKFHPQQLVMPALLFGTVMIVIAVVVTGPLRGENLREAWYPPGNIAFEIILGGVLGLVGAVVVALMGETVPAMRRIRDRLIAMLDFSQLTLWHALAFGLLAGIPEEMLFRGAIQPVVGVLLASLIFGVLHAITPTYTVYATVAGLLLGLLAEWRGDLWAATAAHIVYDAALFIWMARQAGRLSPPNV